MSSLGINLRPRKRSSVSLPRFQTPELDLAESDNDVSSSAIEESPASSSSALASASESLHSTSKSKTNQAMSSSSDHLDPENGHYLDYDRKIHHNRNRSSFSYSYPSNDGSGSWSMKSKTVSFDTDKATTYVGILAFCLLTLYIISGLISSNPNGYVPIIADSAHVELTNDPIIIPKMNDLALFKSRGVPKRAPNDNAKEVKEKPGSSVSNAHGGAAAPGSGPGSTTSFVFDGGKHGPSPSVVVVMGIDYEKYKPDYLTKIIENRVEYAKAHGYGTYMRFVQEFKSHYSDSSSSSSSWAKLDIMRAAFLAFPKAKYFWYIDQSALIMNPLIDIEQEFISSKELENKMLKGIPVVKSADFIKTYKFTKPEDIKMVISQDTVGLNPASFIIHNSDYGISLLEFWGDQLYRTYGQFTESEASALNHLTQWHPCFLSKLAVVPAKYLCSYPPTSPLVKKDPTLAYTDGDFVVQLDCDPHVKTCNDVFQRFWNGRGRVNL
ncbi:Mnn11p [Sugiyamaella lignohabitans]|uniref:Mnn11p n=1 Tax=Sugiyamaella lignohabitans TaxID=796027 RepID=A0A167F8I6_9ASCO|nr:Mnn11p [Sugiyamaella lignohabitans]ANB14955.1 Mnn11p [Sugiyamaella lignohabitans]